MTRQKYRQKESEVRVIGVVLGRQSGRLLEVVNTIEIKYEVTGLKGAAGDIQIDESFAKERIDAYKTMYADLECIGWYSVRGGPQCTGAKDQDAPTAQDLAIHKSVISKLCENALMLIMNPLSLEARDAKRLPLFIYEAR
jgi:COP9 signalosome complex subunit 6